MLKNLFTLLIAASFVTMFKLAAHVDAAPQMEQASIAGRRPWTAVRGSEPSHALQAGLATP